jgi:hypothetical protein
MELICGRETFKHKSGFESFFQTVVDPGVITKKSSCEDVVWIDEGKFFVTNVEQGSEEWKRIRKFRCNASTTEFMITKCRFSDPDEVIDLIISGESKDLSEIEVVNRGIRMEENVMKLIKETFIKKDSTPIEVRHIGLAIPKDEFEISCSPDGIIVDTDMIIEIKVKEKIPESFIHGSTYFSRFKNPEIFDSHYTQMNQNMYILGKKFCLYFVHCPTTSENFFKIVEYDPTWYLPRLRQIKDIYDLRIFPNIKGERIDPDGIVRKSELV